MYVCMYVFYVKINPSKKKYTMNRECFSKTRKKTKKKKRHGTKKQVNQFGVCIHHDVYMRGGAILKFGIKLLTSR